jgi:hypothetical protein
VTSTTTASHPTGQAITPGSVFRIPTPRRWGEWRMMQGRYLVHRRGTRFVDYEIDLWEIDTHRELADWLFHVGGKQLDTPNFFLAMRAVFRSAGWHDNFSGKELASKYWKVSSQA